MKYTKSRLVVYHDNCFDGLTSAWLLWLHFGDKHTDYHPGQHSDPVRSLFPETDAVEIIIADFSYPRPVLEGLIANGRKVIVLDHHDKAIEELTGLPDAILDKKRSGAAIVFDYLAHEFRKVTSEKEFKTLWDYIAYVSDRDRFAFEIPDTKAFTARQSLCDMTIEAWDDMFRDYSNDPESFVREGKLILAAHNVNIAKFIENNLIMVKMFQQEIPALNVPKEYGSDACHELLNRFPKAPFAMYYYEDGLSYTRGPYIGVRARNSDNIKVLPLAKHFGGGGHDKASAFRVPFDKVRMLEMDTELWQRMQS